MKELEELDNPELKKLFRTHLIRGAILLLVLAVLVVGIAFIWDEQLQTFGRWLNDNYGIYGLMAVVFVADLIISPIPPDFALFLIGKSPQHENWLVLVPFLGLISTIAGVFGWLVGKRLKKLAFFQRLINYFGQEYLGVARRFGFWLVVIGALTPLPFSMTCWMAGIFNLPFSTFIIASSFRIPRFVLYYWAIFYSGFLGSFLRSLMEWS